MKKERHELICALIASHAVSTQEQLQQLLQEQDVIVTQATLSRDIRELHLMKRHMQNGFRYVAPEQSKASDGIIREAVLGSDHAGHMAVIHCRAGMAQAACAALDAMHQEGIVGTIAGDDTIFVLLRSEQQAAAFAAQFKDSRTPSADRNG